MISEAIINQILDRVNIADVISGYIPLKRAGRNFKANCPFHHEKTPSFMVSPDKQIFHCFGCGAGGNVFGFLMKYERLEFPEAVQLLADKVGIQIPRSSATPDERSQTSKIHSANDAAANFYHYTLLKMEHGKAASDYLKKRGVTEECIKRLKLGYAPAEWDSFFSHAKRKGMDPKTLEKAGLAVPRSEGGFYDRFRHRIIFPIHNHKGQVVGFGARVLDETLPKYINSPETAVYNKGSHLYGLNLAAEHIKQKDFVIVVEGYLDFLTPFQAGVGNIVASLGTALTVDQVRLLKRFTKNITMVFDADSAGESASLRGLDIAVGEDMNVKVATLPEGYDPDKFVKQAGVDRFLDVINNAKDFFDYKYRFLRLRFPAGDVESKSKIAAQMLETIARVPNAVAKSEYVKRLANNLNVELVALWTELKKVRADNYGQIDLSDAFPKREASCLAAAEKMLLGLVLEDPGLIDKIRSSFKTNGINEENDFKILLDTVCDFYNRHKSADVAKLINHVKDQSHCSAILDACTIVQEVQDPDRCVRDCIKKIKQSQLDQRKKRLEDQIKTAQDAKDHDYIKTLLNEYNTLIRQKVEV
jgi:DNA primase